MEPSKAERGSRARRIGAFALIGMATAAMIAACGGTTASTVDVTLQEFAVLPEVASVPAGSVTFVANNTGPDDEHELVVIKTDLAPDALPVDADGVVPEDSSELSVIGEVEEIAVGATGEVTLDLSAGKYVLICNILQTEPDGTLEAHYRMGMRTAFEVN